MKIKKDQLKEALEIVKPGLADKEIIEQTTSFAFMGGKVITYNDEICISHPIEGIDLEGVIKAEELYKFLGKVKKDEIVVTTEENEILMKAGRARAGFALMLEVLLPIDKELSKKDEYKKLPEKFLKAIEFATPCVSKDMTNPKLACVHLNKEGLIEATDNFRIVRYTLDKELPFETTLIPGLSMKEVLKIEPTLVTEGEGWLHFKNEQGTEISCRTLDERFVDISSVLPKTDDFIQITFPEETDEILEKAKIFSQSMSKQTNEESVSVSITDNRLLIESKSETAWFKEFVKIKDYTGEDFSFSITPYLLQDILKETSVCMLYKNMLKFSSEDWVYISSLRGDVKS